MATEPRLPDPGDLSDAVLALHLRERTPADPDRGWVPAYHFSILLSDSRAPVGLLSLRVGSTDSLRLYAGHVGYAIAEPFRGNRYAARAVGLVLPFARRIGLDPIWITCDPANSASKRTCEIAGAEFRGTVSIPPAHEMYAMGARSRDRYRL